MKGYADLADLPENERIRIIADKAASGELVGFFVDDDQKADRYIRKLSRDSRIRIVDRQPMTLETETVVFVRVGPKGH